MATAVEPRKSTRAPNEWTVDRFGFGRKPNDPKPKYKEAPKRDVPDYRFWPRPNKMKPNHHSFAIYTPAPRSKLGLAPKNPMPSLRRREMERLDPTGVRTALFRRYGRDAVKVGDVLRVISTKGDPFAGVLINLRRRGADTAILLRTQMARTGVEMWFKVFSTKIKQIDVVWRRPKRARRARLYYMRQPKHDMGSVDHLVDTWFRSRVRVGSSKSRGAPGAKSGKKPIVLKRSAIRAREEERAAKEKRKAEREARLAAKAAANEKQKQGKSVE